MAKKKIWNYKLVTEFDKMLKDGTYPIVIRINLNGQRKQIALGISAAPEQWDSSQGRYSTDKRKKTNLHPDTVINNAWLSEKEVLMNDIIDESEKSRKAYTVNQIEAAFLNRPQQARVSKYAENLLQNLKDTNHIGNADCYEGTLHMLRLFDRKFDQRTFSDIDYKFVCDFDIWMQKPRKTEYKSKHTTRIVERDPCSGNTRKYYHKALRAVLNRAIAEGKAIRDTYPYGKGRFDISSLEEETEKRYLSDEDLDKLKNTKLSDIEEIARRIFLFQYYCYGISLMDAALLSESNLVKKDGKTYIIYKRQKTRNSRNVKPIQVYASKELEDLILWFKQNTILVEKYLLPIVSIEGYKDEQLYNHITNRRGKINKYLKDVSKTLKLERVLTTYVSRHTMAMKLQNSGIAREIISATLGHSDLKTTEIYLDSLKGEQVDSVSSVL